MRRSAAIAGLVLLASLACSCTGQPQKMQSHYREPPPRGTVAGIADVCNGGGAARRGAHPSLPPVTVIAHRNGKLFASARIPSGDDHYHLLLPPGTYVVSAAGAGAPPKTATVRPGQMIIVNFPNFCA
jgi:hypothetical protein